MGTKFSKKRQYKISPQIIYDTKLEILKILDVLCKENDLQYFAFGNLLVGCVHYGDIIPDTEAEIWDIGLQREDYDRLVELLKDAYAENGLYLNRFYRGTKYPNELFSVGKLCSVDIGGLIIEQPYWVHLSPFDTVPDDYDFFCGFIRQMHRKNKYYHKILVKYAGSKKKIKRYITRAKFLNDTPGKAFEKRNQVARQYLHAPYKSVGRVILKKSEILTKDQLFPLQYLPFHDMELPCPADYSMWTIPMTPDLIKQTREIQAVDIFLLKEFDRVCQLLGIGYFICGGTMLGCVRHGGFIPWDDDVDVGMLREDYNRFLKEAGQYLDSRCFLQTRESDPEIPYLFSKIRVNNTEYITEYNEHRNYHKGICLDLFPFDVLPENAKEKKKFLKRTKLLVRVHNRFCNKGLPDPVKMLPATTLREKWYRFVGMAQRKLYKRMPLNITQGWYLRHVTKYNHLLNREGGCEVASFVPSYTHIQTEDLLPYKYMPFEDISVKVPNKPEVFLSMQYGNFMEMPPAHKQVGHILVRYKADLE